MSLCAKKHDNCPTCSCTDPIPQLSQTMSIEPIARVTRYVGGHCVIQPTNRAEVLPVGMALYSPADLEAECQRRVNEALEKAAHKVEWMLKNFEAVELAETLPLSIRAMKEKNHD